MCVVISLSKDNAVTVLLLSIVLNRTHTHTHTRGGGVTLVAQILVLKIRKYPDEAAAVISLGFFLL